MQTWIALLRGINVGGRNKLPMKELASLLREIGCSDVTTYIQSGNVVFQSSSTSSETLAARIEDAIESAFGFRPATLLLTADRLHAVMAANPFPEAEADPSKLHLLILAEEPSSPDHDRLDSLRAPTETYELSDGVFYLHAPDGIGRSKLAAQAESALGASGTARNWRTMTKLADLVATLP